MSELACGSTVSKFETGQEDEEYWFDENDEQQLDEMATWHAEMMALPEHLRVGWETLEVNTETDVSFLDESVNTEESSCSKRKQDACITPSVVSQKTHRGHPNSSVACSKSTNNVHNDQSKE
ncbi:unnamed protein product [Adineta steineri]|uniref:Uncharacterized protein n=1 Tax=Adineta steineri TaxID=433720 RepID=A0A813UZ22_9BILA|nr:unnamed protein product [Adineta steineri]CAF1451175.1 unnamed protein product [Adineta steineri]